MLYSIECVVSNTRCILIGFPALYILLCIIYRCAFNKKESKRSIKIKKCLKKILGCKKVFAVSIAFFATAAVSEFVKIVWKPMEEVHHDEYEYIRNSLAEQMDINILFDKDFMAVKIDLAEDSEWKGMAYLKKMHVMVDSDETGITEKRVKAYYDLIDTIYINGDKNEIEGMDGEAGYEIKVKIQNQAIKDYLQEAENWKGKFDNDMQPAYLYQYSRSLRDALTVENADMETLEILGIAAESIVCGEKFLKYGDRNINGREVEIHVNADDIAFFNGKVYYLLAEKISKNIEAEAKWGEEFWMLSFACMCKADGLITENDPKYALINYYIGNIAERMMPKIAAKQGKSEYYFDMREIALEHYIIAKKALERSKIDNDVIYDEEKGMVENIENGIRTVKAWGRPQ